MRIQRRTRLDARRHKPDYAIPLLTGVLVLLGLVVIYSISPALSNLQGGEVGQDYYVYRQFGAIGLGILVFALTTFVPITFWSRIQTPLLVIAGILTLLLLLPGDTINPTINGATRWLVIGTFSFQPSELLKFALIIYLASFLAARIKQGNVTDKSQTFVPLAVVVAILSFVLVVLQRDLGTALVMVIIVLTMMYMAGVRLYHLGLLSGGLAAAALLAVVLVPHRLNRLMTFLGSNGGDAEGAGYHINQALIAVGSGGVLGLGLGRSIQVYGYLPEAANDSIFAIYAEKFGFIGSLILLILLGALLFRLLRVAEHAPNDFTKLVVSGIFAWVLAHGVINIGAMIGILPLTGITLPFLSYGGTSLLLTMAALGLAFNISRYTTFDAHKQRGGSSRESSRYGRRDRRSRYAYSGSRIRA